MDNELSSNEHEGPVAPEIGRRGLLQYARTLFLLTLFVVIILTSISQRWIRQHFETIPPQWDQGYYLYIASRYWHSLIEGGLPALAKNVFTLVRDRAPLVPLTTLPFFLTFGFTLQHAYLVNSVYLFIMLVAVFKAASFLRGWKAGLIAAFVCATLPGVINYSRDFLFEFPMASLLALSLYMLFRSFLFRNRWYSVALGGCLGLTVLAKTMAFAYVGALLVPATMIGYMPSQHRKQVRHNVGFTLVAFALVAGVWYLPNLHHALSYLFSAGFGHRSADWAEAGVEILTFRNLTYYPRFILGYGLSFSYTAIFVALLTWKGIEVWRGRNAFSGWYSDFRASAYAIVTFMLLLGYLILTVTTSKGHERFALPLLPAISILMGCWIEELFSWTMRPLAIAAVALVGLINYWALTFGIRGLPAEIQSSGIVLFSQQHYLTRWFHFNKPWPIAAALNAMAAQLPLAQRSPARVYVIPNHPFINSLTLMAYSEEKQLPFTFTGLRERVFDRDLLRAFDFVITKTGDHGPKFANPDLERTLQAFTEAKQSFSLIRRLPLPDESNLEIFMRNSPSLSAPPTPMEVAHIVYGGSIELVGYDFRPVAADKQSYAITYYWKCLAAIPEDYKVFVHISRSGEDTVIGGQDHFPMGSAYPTYRWRSGEFFADQNLLELPEGSYDVKVGLYLPGVPGTNPDYRPVITEADPVTPIDDHGTRALLGRVKADRKSGGTKQ